MPRIVHKACYGTMFPETLRGRDGSRAAGKVFSFCLVPVGGVTSPDCRVEVNRDEWDDCLRCPEFESCYKLCMARLTLKTAASGI
jgi:hypothetical protein